MRWRKSLCDLAGRRDGRRPELWKQTSCFPVLKEERARLVGIWVWRLAVMPDISVRIKGNSQGRGSDCLVGSDPAFWFWGKSLLPQGSDVLDIRLYVHLEVLLHIDTNNIWFLCCSWWVWWMDYFHTTVSTIKLTSDKYVELVFWLLSHKLHQRLNIQKNRRVM